MTKSWELLKGAIFAVTFLQLMAPAVGDKEKECYSCAGDVEDSKCPTKTCYGGQLCGFTRMLPSGGVQKSCGDPGEHKKKECFEVKLSQEVTMRYYYCADALCNKSAPKCMKANGAGSVAAYGFLSIFSATFVGLLRSN